MVHFIYLNAGEPIEVQYTVTNLGTGTTISSNWKDGIYWSADNVTDNRDIPLATITHTGGNLQPNSDYTVTRTVNVPRNIFGNYWIFVAVDVGLNVYEHVDEDNNVALSEVGTMVIGGFTR